MLSAPVSATVRYQAIISRPSLAGLGLLPHGLLQTRHWRHVTRVHRPIGQVGPIRTTTNGRFRALEICDFGGSNRLTQAERFSMDVSKGDHQPLRFGWLMKLTLPADELIAEAQADGSGPIHRDRFVIL
jgi:hypothetical protein